MSRLGLAVASAIVLASTSAYAATGIVGDIVVTPTGSSAGAAAQAFNPASLPGAGPLQGMGQGSGFTHYQTEVNVGEAAISFKAANATAGLSSSTFSSTTVGFNFRNEGGPVNFESTITAAGMGFQVVNRFDCTSFDQCSPVRPEFGSFQDFAAGGGENVIGQVGFDFNIADNGSSIYSLRGFANLVSVSRSIGETTYRYVRLDDASLFGRGSASRRLRGFTTVGNDITSAGFTWADTPVHRLLGSGNHFITYTTSAYSYVNANCRGGYSTNTDTSNCLVGFAGFGDPIGRGGAVEEALSGRFGAFAGPQSAIPGAASFYLPTYNDDTKTLGFQSTANVPEPATWGLMIMGFGSIGAVLRRRRMVVARA